MDKDKDFCRPEPETTLFAHEEYGEAFEHVLKLLKETKESNLRANQAKSAFLANISHEIRTPMNAIMGFAQMLKQSGLNDTQKDHVEVILDCGAKLLCFINDLLELSNLELGKVEINSLPCDPVKLLSQVWDEHLPRIKTKKLKGELILPQDLPQILLDRRMFRRVLNSILENAVKFTESGFISMNCSVFEDTDQCVKLLVSISDTGIGIAEESVHGIFNLFEQADNSITRHYGGLGMGLGLSQRIVKFMGGRITVVSEPEKGSCFHVCIPVSKA
ncbi:MAG: ATP-binding protein [Candidatus Cloacimonadaceae bacterium]|nr:ATP-binding protein [Candidatus Cloacimonadaceae bacterium]MDP3115149.1 ATP-binding protein [Candidatus Cloacimonadaceae bacterium]